MESEKPVTIIVGLGNPGARYARTRHNAGFMVLDALAHEGRMRPWTPECHSLTGICEIAGQRVLLAKPLTFMNLSGQAVSALLEKHDLGLESLVVILDDVNLPFGKIRVRERGSAGGHHGLESIIRALGSAEFVRVRIGIAEESLPEDKADYVLSEFPREREAELQETIQKAGDAVTTILSDGVSRAMSLFNAGTQ